MILYSFFLKANIYRPNIIELLNPRRADARVIHGMLGTLGQLFDDINAPIATPKSVKRLRVRDCESGHYEVFDTEVGEWVHLTEELYNRIPRTFTFAPRPENAGMELDYFVRGCGLVKHSFVWSVNPIPRDVFEKVASNMNITWCGRYTLTPWFPRVQNLGRMMHGFYIMDDDDWRKIYK